ncbi:retrovirus-related pol polyprotein from transposon TNT 1-94 [Tanacetum coccineum]|uniref:Retrovirus-related pol polyprotein from transposon TNT 1-94 n=1 Tax=Tanacetum coccineum TaxID=301880 RepID=A0ABQ5H5T3_9ASTR
MFVPSDSTVPKLQTAEDLQGDALLHYDAEMELMNLILLSIPNEIYNSVDACTTAKEILQPEWLKYVTQVCLAKRLKVDSFDDLFDYLQQFEKLVNASRAKKLEKSHDPLALVAHTGSSSRNTSSYYVTHPTSVVDYDDEYQQDDVQTNSEDPLASAMLLLARAITQNFSNPTNNRLRTSSNTRNQAIIQGDRVNIQSRNSGNTGRNTRRAYVQEEVVEGSNAQNETENVQRTLRTSSSGNTSTVQCYNCSGKGHYARNCPKPRVRDSKYFMEQMLLAKQDEAGVILTDEQNDFLFADASRMEEIEELSANICLMARIQPANNTSDAGPSYDSAFISEVQSSSINENKEQMYPTHTKIINSTIGDDQIDSNIIFDKPNGHVNSGSVEKDTHVPDLYVLKQLARNACLEAEKQQLFAQKVQQQNTTLTNQLELYKERVRVLENINEDNNYLNEFLKADRKAKHFNQQAQFQFIRDRDIIRDLEKQRDKLDLVVNDYKRKNEKLQKTHLILKLGFRSKTCYVRNLEGNDLLIGGRKSNLYTISISDMAASLPVCLMSKATLIKSWLWHRQLSHLNLGTRLDLVDGLPKFKYGKDHLCYACERGKSKKASHPPTLVPSNHSKLELLQMDLCRPIRVASINGKKYIRVIVDDYSRYTWVYFLHSKDATPKIIKKFIA